MVVGDPEKSGDRVKSDILGVVDSRIIMRFIFKHFRIESSLHSWLQSEKSHESLFKKPLKQVNIGTFDPELIHFM